MKFLISKSSMSEQWCAWQWPLLWGETICGMVIEQWANGSNGLCGQFRIVCFQTIRGTPKIKVGRETVKEWSDFSVLFSPSEFGNGRSAGCCARQKENAVVAPSLIKSRGQSEYSEHSSAAVPSPHTGLPATLTVTAHTVIAMDAVVTGVILSYMASVTTMHVTNDSAPASSILPLILRS